MEHVKRSHPLRVTLGEVVVDGHDMHTVSCQRIEEYRQGSDEGLTLTSSHLGNLTLMQYNTTEELYVIVYHLPFKVVTTCCPVVVVYCLVTVNGDAQRSPRSLRSGVPSP